MQRTTPLLASLTICLSPWALSSTLYTGSGTAVHDARSSACHQAERAARLDAARQAESYVQRSVYASVFENQHGLQQSRSEFIETTVYGSAALQGTAKEQVRLLDNQHVECRVEAQYRIDTAAIRQHFQAEQARVSRQTEREQNLAALHQELADNQQAYQALLQAMPAEHRGSRSVSAYCEARLPLAQCETLLGELIAQPYQQELSNKLGIASHHLQPRITMQGSTELTSVNSQLNQANWQGDYQLSFTLSDPLAERNQQLHRDIRRQQAGYKLHTATQTKNTASKRPDWLRFSLAYGTDCLACSTSTMRQWKALNKPNALLVRTNYLQFQVQTSRWLSLNAGLYGENYAMCQQPGRGDNCADIRTQNALMPALGISVHYKWAYAEAMHLFALRNIELGERSLDKGYQRFEFGFSTQPLGKNANFALGIATRTMPAVEQTRWNSTAVTLRLGYTF